MKLIIGLIAVLAFAGVTGCFQTVVGQGSSCGQILNVEEHVGNFGGARPATVYLIHEPCGSKPGSAFEKQSESFNISNDGNYQSLVTLARAYMDNQTQVRIEYQTLNGGSCWHLRQACDPIVRITPAA